MVAPIGCSQCPCCGLWAAKANNMETMHALERNHYAENVRSWEEERAALKARVEELLAERTQVIRERERLEHPKETP